jgi:membrane protein required for colicin V production
LSNLPVNLVDLGIAGVLLISGLLAFTRGLVREVLSIGAWVAAVLATIYGLPHLREFTRTYIKAQLLADAITGVTIFIATLVVCAAISHALARNVRGSGFGALDRSLGFLFGLLRGALLVCLAYLVMLWAIPKPADQPEVVRQAKSLPLVAQGAGLLSSLLPKDAFDRGAAAANEAKTQIEQEATRQMLQNPAQPQPPGQTPAQVPAKPAAGNGNPGYNAGERKDLDRLIQGTQ